MPTYTMDGYEKFVRGLAAPNSLKDRNSELGTAALGLVGEAGETADYVKKILFHEMDFTTEVKDKMLKECGDILWYTTFAAVTLEVGLEELPTGDIDLPIKAQFNDDLRRYSLAVGHEAGLLAGTMNDIIDGRLEYREDVRLLMVVKLGRLFRNLMSLISVLGSSLPEVLEMNVAKLSRRYKDKKFTKAEFMRKEDAKQV